MATTRPHPPDVQSRDADGFGGLVPSGAVARAGETLVAALCVEHHGAGAVIPLMALTDAPGLLEWDATAGLSVRDDRDHRYEAEVLASSSGLGQMQATIWLAPTIPPEARRLELTVDRLMRVNPARGGGAGIALPLSGGPWSLGLDLVPQRTVVDPPAEPPDRRRPHQAGSVPARAHGAFIDLVPVGQARILEGIAVCAVGIERYWDRWVLDLAALGPSGDEAAAPAIGRAVIAAWDDRGNRYRATPIQGAARGTWSEVAVELVPALDEAAGSLAIEVREVPRGTDGGRRLSVPGPFTFGVRLPGA